MCLHLIVAAEPDGLHCVCTACGRIQTLSDRRAEIWRLARLQRILEAPPLSQERWRHLQQKVKAHVVTGNEALEFADEVIRRLYQPEILGAKIGVSVGALIVLGLVLLFLAAIRGGA